MFHARVQAFFAPAVLAGLNRVKIFNLTYVGAVSKGSSPGLLDSWMRGSKEYFIVPQHVPKSCDSPKTVACCCLHTYVLFLGKGIA